MSKSEAAELIRMMDGCDPFVPTEEILLTVDQVAERLGVSAQTVRNWEVQEKLIPAKKTEGGHRRYTLKQVIDLKKAKPEMEIFLRTTPDDLLTGLRQVLTNFCPSEQISITIKYDPIKGKAYFTIDSEDGLQTYTKVIQKEQP